MFHLSLFLFSFGCFVFLFFFFPLFSLFFVSSFSFFKKKKIFSRLMRSRRLNQKKSSNSFAVYLLCILRHTLCLTPDTLSTTAKRTENNKCSAVAYVDGQAQTLLLTRGPVPTPWRLSAPPTQRTLASVGSTLSKQFVLTFEIHICCGEARPKPRD